MHLCIGVTANGDRFNLAMTIKDRECGVRLLIALSDNKFKRSKCHDISNKV